MLIVWGKNKEHNDCLSKEKYEHAQVLASVQAKEDNLTNVLENVMEKASQQVIVLF